MADEVNVQVRFTMHDDETGLDYSDALYYPVHEVPDQSVIDADKQVRFDAWKAVVTASPDPAPAPPVDPAAQMADIAAAMQDLAQRAADLAASSDVPAPEPDVSALPRSARRRVTRALGK